MKKKLLIVLLVFVSFILGVILTASVFLLLNRFSVQLCHKKLVTPSEKELILAEYIQIPNPFFENYYDGLDLLNSKNIYVKKDPAKNIDFGCFTREDIYPWSQQIYLESKEGELHKIECRK